MFVRRTSDHQFLRHDFLINHMITADALLQQVVSHTSHLMGLILDGRHPRCHILGMQIIRKADQRHILRDTEAQFLDGGKRREGDGIIKGEDGVRPVLHLQHLLGGLHAPVEINPFTLHQFPVNLNTVLAQCLQIAMLTAPHHVQVVRSHENLSVKQVLPKNTRGIPILAISSKCV